ncbi:hypothetical protein LK13_05005 [Paenibacillus polymyxa]|uniref:hypothetical protein n=1 Tax=Paenibacillus polymyxa TaxID=1406 RepID=UPI00042E8911|nr:hypothetical protein [Paenibacillus polymyxa]AHM67200.1 hypothetical protein PPSQR21_035620 [Paenibacillus polymyxa SQR-21]AIY07993.1 hypothetical protein LK13_05005 [Paenibacillus polymyxa]
MINNYSTTGELSPIMKDCNITVYNQLKFETVIARKNELYIPLIEESFKLIGKCKSGDLFSELEISFMKEIVQKQYKYRVDDELLLKLNDIDNLVNSFNKIDVINICGNIIVDLFTKGFIRLYGDIIEGEAPIYYDGEIVDYETVYPEEYENIKMIAYDKSLVMDAVQQRDDYIVYENEIYNRSLVTMFEFALADRNKRYSSSRIPVIDWAGAPEYYIASLCNLDEEYSKNKEMIKKRDCLKDISDLCKDVASLLDQKLKDIFERYEKE